MVSEIEQREKYGSTCIGLAGLADMGQNLALNVAEKGLPISVSNRTTSKVDEKVIVLSTGGNEWYENTERQAKEMSQWEFRVRDSGLCVTYIGKGRPGNFVKMVHNGIEYGDMQLIAEAYDLLKSVGKLLNEELQSVFSEWNKGELLDNRGDEFAKEIIDRQSTWRRVRLAIISGISTPTMLASLAYFDTYRRQ
ncbi:hypothetical protein Gorai_020831, partial [Gossypium raimondii]|nr:hypothetical protein [Gossypium raimondii]